VKLSDFGISKSLDSTAAMSNTAVGSFRYMSPERLLGKHYDASGDVWSVGILLIQLWEKHYPFEDCSSTPIDLISELESVDFRKLVSKKKYPALLRTFILSMLEMTPGDRPQTVELSESEWLRECDITSITDAQEVCKR
jgi:serine/threonine-protein kinase